MEHSMVWVWTVGKYNYVLSSCKTVDISSGAEHVIIGEDGL